MMVRTNASECIARLDSCSKFRTVNNQALASRLTKRKACADNRAKNENIVWLTVLVAGGGNRVGRILQQLDSYR